MDLFDDQENTEEYAPRRMKRKPRRVGRAILLSLLALVVIVAGVGGFAALKFGSALAGTNTFEDSEVFPTENRPTKDAGDESVNILLLGADAGDGALDVSATSTDRRSDSMMLVHIPEDRKGVYVMSIMRDMWTDIPGYREAKINAAISVGGVPKLVSTLEGLLDTKIDHVAMIDFQGFRDLTTAIGGVTVDNPKDFTAYKTDYFFQKGEITLEGERALRWVRERHAFTDGDYQRVRNQQAFMKAIFKKVLSPQTLADPVKLFKVVDSIAPYLTMDRQLKDPGYLVGLALQMKDTRAGDIHSFTLPTAGTGRSADGQSIVLQDKAAMAKVAEALKTDTMANYFASMPASEKGN